MGRVTEHVLVAVMLLTALQSALGQTAATAENQETELSPLETDRQDQDPLVQQFTASVSQLQQQCQSHQQTLSEQMSEQMSELEKKILSRQHTLSKQMSEQMSELQKESLSYREDLAKLTQRIDRLLQERSLNHQGDLAELTKRSDSLPKYHSSTAAQQSSNDSSDTCARSNPVSGVRTAHPCHDPFPVYCHQTTYDGGWIVFQRRVNASVDFNRKWRDYRNGFGDMEGNYWLGLYKLHKLTTSQRYDLLIDLEKWDGTKGSATYKDFYVDGPGNNFAMHFRGFTGGIAGDGLVSGSQFSTKDRDNDRDSEHCAQRYQGAWWYYSCIRSNLNGVYKNDSSSPNSDGIIWSSFAGYFYSLKTSEMKIQLGSSKLGYHLFGPRLAAKLGPK